MNKWRQPARVTPGSVAIDGKGKSVGKTLGIFP
jgi:hypothetical protein